MKRLLGIVLVLCLGACSVAFQDSVRSSGTYCSTSRFWYVSDFLVAAGLTYIVVSTDPGETGAYAPGGVLAASALYGVWKRRNCVRHQETATPEQWARDSARKSRRDAAQAEQMRNLTARLQESQSAPPPTSTPAPSSQPPAQTRPPTSRPGRQTTNTPPGNSSPPGGACRCRGYPVGHPRATEQRPESCSAMPASAASSCDASCKAQGYAIGLFRSMSSC